jgi:hypothetical protein
MTEVLQIPIQQNGAIHEPDPVFSYPIEDKYRLFRLDSKDPFTRKFFPSYVERCLKFIDLTNSDSDPIWLGSLLYSNFYQATNYIHCLVAINEQEHIIAHSLCYLENDFKLGIHVHILQIWKSEGGDEIINRGMELIDEYGRQNNCKTIIYAADDLSRLRLYKRYGFNLHRVLGRKDLR